MDVSHLLSNDLPHSARSHQPVHPTVPEVSNIHHYGTRRSHSGYSPAQDHLATGQSANGLNLDGNGVSPPSGLADSAEPLPKDVAFELIIDNAASHRARLPMRVQIFPHDNTDSIITTVKNFHGLYDPSIQGVNFEDAHGRVIIARYENFANNSTVYVRVVYDEPQAYQQGNIPAYLSASPRKMHNFDDAPQLLSSQPSQILHYGQSVSRPPSRAACKRSTSPHMVPGGRGPFTQQARSKMRSRDVSLLNSFEDAHPDGNTFSDSDGGANSVSSSRKSRSENAARAEISTENILEGGRRKRTKFESSELPLFVPPVMPASHSVSSISPQRRSTGLDNPSPFAKPHQRNISYTYQLPSPQIQGPLEQRYGSLPHNGSPYSMAAPASHGHRLRDRNNTHYTTGRSSLGATPLGPGPGLLPTPDPTIASCISDEDVALQLMRLGDTSNVSYGRTSASTMDETMSGQADIASSATSDSGSEAGLAEPSALPSTEDRSTFGHDTGMHGLKSRTDQVQGVIPSSDSFEPDGDEADGDYYDGKTHGIDTAPPNKNRLTHKQLPKVRTDGIKKAAKASKSKSSAQKKPKGSLPGGPNVSMSPASALSQSRKGSVASPLNFQHHLGVDEADLSTKPRCQRCRKSKKGCDRQRPCQRCKDAGIGVDGCVSEDEGNGRKGRFGRHMGVSVKKDQDLAEDAMEPTEQEAAGAILTGMSFSPEKSKKRKR